MYLPISLALHLAFPDLATATAPVALRGLREDVDKDVDGDKTYKVVGGEPSTTGAYPAYAIPMGLSLCGASVSVSDDL